MRKQYQIICTNCGPITNKKLYCLPGKTKIKCPQCSYENLRENFGPTLSEQNALDIAFDFAERGIQAYKESESEESKKLLKQAQNLFLKLNSSDCSHE